jgi:hypothetical protein
MKNKLSLLSLVSALVLVTLACAFGGDSAILYRDDFSNKNGNWAEDREQGITDYDQDGYRIQVLETNWYYWTTSGLDTDFSNVDITIDTTKLGGPDDNEFGVICRYVDENNFYYFTISSDGFYGITKIVNNEFELIGQENLLPSEEINQGDGSNNQIRAICNDNNLQLYANGTLLANVTDSDLTTGDIGLIAGTYEEPGTDILFDNLLVVDPNAVSE